MSDVRSFVALKKKAYIALHGIDIKGIAAAGAFWPVWLPIVAYAYLA